MVELVFEVLLEAFVLLERLELVLNGTAGGVGFLGFSVNSADEAADCSTVLLGRACCSAVRVVVESENKKKFKYSKVV